MPEKRFDAIVLGVGSMGSATCYFLSARGYQVLGLEQFSIPHESGSHTGQSRIIRKAYFEDAGYVPLMERAYENWKQLEELTGEQVYFKTGLLYVGPPDHLVMKGVKEAALRHKIELRFLNREQASSVFPPFTIPKRNEVIIEPDAGFIKPEKAITLYKQEAEKKGAVIHSHETVVDWKKEKDGIEVITDKSTYHCRKLIITAGAWTNKMISGLPVALKITRQVIAWVRPNNENDYVSGNFPCWMIADHNRDGVLYGFPFLDKESFGSPGGLKFAWHSAAEPTDPDKVNRKVSDEEIRDLVKQVATYLPVVESAELVATKTCLYANSPDENFILDHLPGHDNDVTIACGFSGHGFKFVSVIGEILADLSMEGKTELPIDFLRLTRFET